jgi:hypothetical protein
MTRHLSPLSILVLALALMAGGLMIAEAQTKNGEPARKKGVCLTTGKKNAKDWQARVASLNPSWHYSWGAALPAPEPEGVEFVPMIWGYWGANKKFTDRIETLRQAQQRGELTHLLGFNEPDGKKQANMTVAKAIEAWPYLEKTGLRLGSPAPVHADREWLQQFMAEAKKRNYRVDFICVHWYGGPNADALVNRLKKIHQMYDKPIWITEFAVADWKAKSREQNRHSPETVLRFMKEILPRLDELDFVERYAWFSGAEDHKALGPSALFKDDGSLTELGQFYASHGVRRP